MEKTGRQTEVKMMEGKHEKWIVHALATLSRERLRSKVARLVDWEPLVAPDRGCTAIIGACSKLPDILMANLRCLWASRWPELRRVVVVVDCAEGVFPPEIERDIKSAFPELNAMFLYYSAEQTAFVESLRLPFIYSWLSWCIALKHTRTSHVLFHDYDALVLGPKLGERYRSFVASEAKVQGIRWYQSNGIESEDHLATTFEAFMDTAWLRSSQPVALFNKLRVVRGRSIDFDTTLDLQHRLLGPSQRTIMPMTPDELVHPTQMIHQYTMFRRSPAAALPCFSIPMIPFFRDLGGCTEAIEHATQALELMEREELDLLGDGTRINLSALDVAQVDWLLKQIVQACIALSLAPDHRVYVYGRALYRIVGTPADLIWRGDFTDEQRAWIDAAAQVSCAEATEIRVRPSGGRLPESRNVARADHRTLH
jgi:hypothetical protein